MAAVGAGVIDEELACYSMGTAEVTSISFRKPQMTKPMLESNYPCYCHAVNDRFFTITLNQSGGLSLEWFQDVVMGLRGIPEGERSAAYADLISRVQISPSSVFFLPHIVGSGTPTCDHFSRGSFLGLSLKTSRDDLFQAVVDALGFEERLNMDQLAQLGIPVAEMRAVGGGARSPRLLELKATILNRPICTLKTREAALMGAAMISQVATGQFADLSAARDECVKIDVTVEPVTSATAAYTAAYGRYRKIYGILRSHYHEGEAVCPDKVVG
jgi:xylulokinase